MAMIGLRVPAEVGRLLQTIEVPGKKVDSGSYHVTLFYLGGDVATEQLTRAVSVIDKTIRGTMPFTVRLDRVDSFDGNEDGVPVICPVNAKPLTMLRDELAEALDEAGVEYSKRFPKFRGHVTLSYANEPYAIRLLPPVEWSVTEVVLWGGDNGENRLTATFPFAVRSKEAFYRAFIRLARTFK